MPRVRSSSCLLQHLCVPYALTSRGGTARDSSLPAGLREEDRSSTRAVKPNTCRPECGGQEAGGRPVGRRRVLLGEQTIRTSNDSALLP